MTVFGQKMRITRTKQALLHNIIKNRLNAAKIFISSDFFEIRRVQPSACSIYVYLHSMAQPRYQAAIRPGDSSGMHGEQAREGDDRLSG